MASLQGSEIKPWQGDCGRMPTRKQFGYGQLPVMRHYRKLSSSLPFRSPIECPRSDLPQRCARPQPAVTIKVVMCYAQVQFLYSEDGRGGKNAKAVCSRVRVWRGRPYDPRNLRLRRQIDAAGGERPFATN